MARVGQLCSRSALDELQLRVIVGQVRAPERLNGAFKPARGIDTIAGSSMIADPKESSVSNRPRKKPRRPCNRPRVHPARGDGNIARPEKVTVRLSPKEFLLLRWAAKYTGRTIAKFLRDCALRHAACMRLERRKAIEGCLAESSAGAATADGPGMTPDGSTTNAGGYEAGERTSEPNGDGR